MLMDGFVSCRGLTSWLLMAPMSGQRAGLSGCFVTMCIIQSLKDILTPLRLASAPIKNRSR